jgi:hypothetical protein
VLVLRIDPGELRLTADTARPDDPPVTSRRRLLLPIVAPLAALLAGCDPLFMSGGEVDVRGAFHADGRCQFVTPRGTLPRPGQRAKVVVNASAGGGNVAVGENTVYDLSCYSVGDSAGAGYVMAFLSAPPGVPLAAGRYRVVQGRIPVGGAHVFVSHPGYATGTRGAGFTLLDAGHISLEAESGEIEILSIAPTPVPDRGVTNVPNPRVEARFRVRARRVWSLE